MATPIHSVAHITPVAGMTFLGHSEGFDVYFVPHPDTGIHAITIVGEHDYDWDSCLIMFIRQSISKGDRRYSEGPWALGVAKADRLNFADSTDLGGVLASLEGPTTYASA